MGNSGIRKLWFLDSPVETPFKSIHEINVIDINKSEESLSQYKGQKVVIVNVAIDSPELNDQLNYLKSLPYQVLLFPKCDHTFTYQQIADKLQGFKVYQKVELNGQFTHPLYKFLKRQTPQLYDEKLANGRQIKQDFCKFLISEEGQPIKHLYRNPTILSKILIKEYTNLKSEELAFRYAALAKLRTQELEFEALHQLDPIEHWDISKISLLPQIFTLLANLHRSTRSDCLIQYPQVEAVNRITALLDPNMFPVQDLSLKLHTSDSVTIWDKSKTQRVTQNLGFKLNLGESTIDHSDAGEGVFLETLPANKRLVPAGTLLGFVPGVIYDNYQSYGEKTPPDMHFFRFDGPIFDFTSRIYYPYVPGYGFDEYDQKISDIQELAARSNRPYRNRSKGGYELVKGEDINPYALGHKINHTPRNKSTNVSLIDIFVPKTFFPEELMKFWPTQYFSTTQDFLQTKSSLDQHYKNHIRGLGFISVTEIRDGEELFLDYLESCLFNMEIESPDWLIKPPPLHPQICKCNMRQESLLMMLLEDYAFQKTKDGQNFDKFYKSVLRENHQYL